ncbi:ATP-dependent RNA helicase HrpA [Corynebacterium sp. TAE3-ERU12]|uniref:ATP-dependent RNA helicase HrpA n=1 Tax=Corynebacterium sp. TAE3-ERU12 TaxID=2849491 RepID=UPI001C479B96|nr:ATP-dependent RNA helicase HrpA [Corynebacterium sp. TAE3-ERU12]MBV7295296.1 ATP-dependent RNA helicase HrpA [Corynebacterium sp. TAE3-ERU12]
MSEQNASSSPSGHGNSRRRGRGRSRGSGPDKRPLYDRLDGVSLSEARSFRRRLKRAGSAKAIHAIGADIELARQRMEQRAAGIPTITYPENLPVSGRRDDIRAAIESHQVTVIAGETGSGKTTQIPKILLEMGRGVRGKIGHTQPRRLAARSVADRIADELGEKVGQHVGYAIRFDDKVSRDTCVKLMTDGILLAEIQRDRLLLEYDTIIIDEAHERSLNIDFLLGYLKQLLPKRPDLKVIITSATIDPERFAEHFADDAANPAPIIEVSGRTYPVEVRYRPLERESQQKNGDTRVTSIDPIDGVVAACEELMREGDGDILCFFSGERDIRDAADAIEGKNWRGVEVLPLFGRLSNAEQHRVFGPHSSRRIVLSTNIAETSLTVPGIRYVVDTGEARISRYSTRTKVQRLPIEPISQASANQRSGRCGRVAAGVAIRLYSEQDFQARPEFTEPEILRTNLASVILQMASLGLGDIAAFPFVEAPEQKSIRDGVNLLDELGAIETDTKHADTGPTLTDVGRDLSRLPVDPQLGRMLVEGHRNGVLRLVTIIVAALSLQDPRERPLEKRAQADQAHARFTDKTSDFLSYLRLWRYLAEKRRELSGNQFRKLCMREYLHYLRVREWEDLVRQLNQITAEMKWDAGLADDDDRVHQSLLAGLLSRIGVREGEGKEFTGTRNTSFVVHPSSALSKKPPRWVMAAEIVETSRMFARDVGRIEPQWVEKLAAHLLKHNYAEPHWSSKRAAAMALQTSTLYGVPVVQSRPVPYHRIDAEAARDMFIRHALIDGEWNAEPEFQKTNRALLEQAAEVEEKARRRGIVVDDETLHAFYDARIPHSVTTGADFLKWWKHKRHDEPSLLDFDPASLVDPQAEEVSETAFPDLWRHGSLELQLGYRFEPGAPDDGVTLKVPLPLLAGIRHEGFDWLVPGLRAELAEALIRTLPKPLRKTVVPAPDFAAKALEKMTAYARPITQELADALRSLGGSGISATDFNDDKLPDHLRFNFAAVDRSGTVIDQDRDLAALQKRQSDSSTMAMSKAARRGGGRKPKGAMEAQQQSAGGGGGATVVRGPVQKWTAESLGAVEETVTTYVDGHRVVAYPALVVQKDGVAIQVMPTKQQAEAAMMTSTLTLLLRECTVKTAAMVKGLPLQQRVSVDAWPHGGAAGLVEDCRITVVRDALVAAGGPVRDPEAFERLRAQISPQVSAGVRQLVVGVAQFLPRYQRIREQVYGWDGAAMEDMRQQLAFMLPRGAVAKHGWHHLRHMPRYLEAMEIRLEDMDRDPQRDADCEDQVRGVAEELAAKLKTLPEGRRNSAAVREIGWRMQELRVSLFAQRLGTAGSVSPQRISKQIQKLR